MSEPKVISVILNTNRRDDTLECLRSLRCSGYSNQQAIILDNRSTDGSLEAIRAEFPDDRILPLTQNRGYAGNNNVGVSAALEQGADWVFVLNEDTVLAPDCLRRLVRVGEMEPRAGVVGPTVYHHDEPEVIQSAGGMLGPYWRSLHLAKNESGHSLPEGTRQVEWISGCGILLRRAAIEEVGLFDERYFYYWEETEWCIRAARAGWKILHVPTARLWHKGVQRDYRPRPDVTYYATRNRLLTLAKHHAPVSAWAMLWLETLRTCSSWTLRPKWRHMRPHRHAVARGVFDFFAGRWGGPVRL